MFEKAIIEFIQKSPRYIKLKTEYEAIEKNKANYRCVATTPEMGLEYIIYETLESAIAPEIDGTKEIEIQLPAMSLLN